MAGIYLHIPFCRKACLYCDFHFSTQLKNKSELVKMMLTELKNRKQELEEEKIKTIYFGGGTPSVLLPEELQLFLQTIQENYLVDSNVEITLEANPEDLTKAYLQEIKNVGVNRLSIGIQSFIEEELTWMNRIHSVEQSIACVKLAQEIGIDNISLDLIYGSKFQDQQQWEYNLQKLFELDVPHFSAYNLTVEEKTALGHAVKKGKEHAIDENKSELFFKILQQKSFEHGYIAYEISNYGKAGYFSRHNTSYWKGEPYLGIGPAAHSFNKNKRSWNISNNAVYIQKMNSDEQVNQVEILDVKTQMNEYLMTGLRTIWGCDLNKMERGFGKEYTNEVVKCAQSYIEKKMLRIEKNNLILTAEGKLFADRIASDLFIL